MMSLAFTHFKLPKGTSLFVYDPDHKLVRGPYTAKDATRGVHWVPVIRGDVITVEMVVPAERRSAAELTIGKVAHGYRSLSNRSSSKSGTCNLDATCEQADPWSNQVRSVGLTVFIRNGKLFSCSGTLVNNTAKNGRPLFLTAEHCVSDPSVARTMTFYWNYQNPTCRTPGTSDNASKPNDELADQTSAGAVLRARYGNKHVTGDVAGRPDLSLVEIDDAIPASYDLYLSGWTAEGNATQEATTIHHPQGGGKRISFDRDPSYVVRYPLSSAPDFGPVSTVCSASLGTNHLEIGDWEIGTTEEGSSGAPLFNENKKIVGVLSGSCAECGAGTDLPAWYGRLAAGFDEGDYEGRTLNDVLAPTSTATKTLGGMPLTSPPPVENLRITNVTPSSVTLKWNAPENVPNVPSPTDYDLRVRPRSPIESDSSFEEARRVSNMPNFSPGKTQSVTVPLNPDSSYHFGLRTLNAAKTASSISRTKQAASTAPPPVDNFQIQEISSESATLRWKVPESGPYFTTPKTYDLRVRPSTPIESDSSFEEARRISDVPSASPGNTQSVTVSLNPDTSYYLGIRTLDMSKNASRVVTAEEDATPVSTLQVREAPFPNPASTQATATIAVEEPQTARITVYDILGRRVGMSQTRDLIPFRRQTISIDVSSLPSGVYFLRIEGISATRTEKIVVKR